MRDLSPKARGAKRGKPLVDLMDLRRQNSLYHMESSEKGPEEEPSRKRKKSGKPKAAAEQQPEPPKPEQENLAKGGEVQEAEEENPNPGADNQVAVQEIGARR